MTVSKILMAGFTGLSISLALGQPRPVSATIAITHAAVVDTKGGPIQRDMTVIIQDHRISAVVKSENVPRGAQVLDGRGWQR